MPLDSPLVLKLGGSLMEWPGLPDRLAALLGDRRDERPVLVVGGGAFADAVRGLDRVHGIGEARSHALALRAMDLSAHAIAAMVGGLVVVERLEDLGPSRARGTTPVLAPRLLLDEEDRTAADPLPHSWAVTSDAIAARVAERLGGALLLLKSTAAAPGLDRRSAAAIGLVDPAFPDAARRLRSVAVLNLRDPAARPVPLG